ncbi:hypothetical protein EYC59_06320 [Candidatus Saccharibacteria bacterium]|nr:MAG: hypothetical protein EYC59_06320 [Candidatus Saccharibacteria bacterium]
MSELSTDTQGDVAPADGASERIVRQAHYLATIIRCRIDRPETFRGPEERLRVLAPRVAGSSRERALQHHGDVSVENRTALELLYATRHPLLAENHPFDNWFDAGKTITQTKSIPVGEGFYVQERVDYEKTIGGLSALCFELFLVRYE